MFDAEPDQGAYRDFTSERARLAHRLEIDPATSLPSGCGRSLRRPELLRRAGVGYVVVSRM